MKENIARLEQYRQQGGSVKQGPGKPTADELREANRRLEERVLGAALMNPEAMAYLAERLKPKHFTSSRRSLLFRTMLELMESGQEPDPDAVLVRLQQEGKSKICPSSYIVEVFKRGRLANFESVVAQVRKRGRRDAIVAYARELASRAANPTANADELLDEFLDVVRAEPEPDAKVDAYEGQAAQIFERHWSQKGFIGEPLDTGLVDLDRALGPLHGGSYLILSAHPGVGKSALALSIARHNAARGRHVVYLSLEMSRKEQCARLLAAEARIPFNRIYIPEHSPHDAPALIEALNRLDDYSLTVTDDARTIEDTETLCRGLKRQDQLSMLIIDYEGKLRCRNASREYERSLMVSGRLRDLAKDLDIVVLVIAKFKRGCPEDERPRRSWISGGTHLEYDPTHIFLLHRADEESPRVDIYIEKNRAHHGPKKTTVAFIGQYMTFENWTSR